MSRTIHIAMAADADFTVPLCLAMYSMVRTANKDTHYRFHLLDSGIDRRLLDLHPFDYCCYDVRGRLKELPCGGRFPYTVYHRLLLPELLPEELDTVLYLDSDIMVLEDLGPLHRELSAEHPVAAVPWVVLGRYREEFGKVLQNFPERMGLEDDGTPYFYSSMLLMDLAAMRKEGTSRHLIDLARNSKEGTLLWPDQDVINAGLRHRILGLPLRYNVIPLFLEDIEQESDEAKEAYRYPAIIHFAARKPNILTGPRDDLEQKFFELWRGSPWSRTIPYPLISLRDFPRGLAYLVQLPMRLCIHSPRLLGLYGRLLSMMRGGSRGCHSQR